MGPVDTEGLCLVADKSAQRLSGGGRLQKSLTNSEVGEESEVVEQGQDCSGRGFRELEYEGAVGRHGPDAGNEGGGRVLA